MSLQFIRDMRTVKQDLIRQGFDTRAVDYLCAQAFTRKLLHSIMRGLPHGFLADLVVELTNYLDPYVDLSFNFELQTAAHVLINDLD